MATEASSSTSAGSKVFGSSAGRTAVHRRLREGEGGEQKEQTSNCKNARRTDLFIFMRSLPLSTRASETTSSQHQHQRTSRHVLRETTSTLPVRAAGFPGRQRFGDAQTEDAKIGLAQDEDRNRNPKLRVENRLQVRQNMNQKKPRAVQSRSASLQDKSELRKASALVESTRAAAAQPAVRE